MTKEKEASTPSCTFSCLKYLVTINLGTQTLLNDFHITEVFLESRHKEVSLVECHLDIRPESYRASAFLLSCHPDLWFCTDTIAAILSLRFWSKFVIKFLCLANNSAVLNIIFHGSWRAPSIDIRDFNFIYVQHTLVVLLNQVGVDIVGDLKLIMAILVNTYSAKLRNTC